MGAIESYIFTYETCQAQKILNELFGKSLSLIPENLSFQADLLIPISADESCSIRNYLKSIDEEELDYFDEDRNLQLRLPGDVSLVSNPTETEIDFTSMASTVRHILLYSQACRRFFLDFLNRTKPKKAMHWFDVTDEKTNLEDYFRFFETRF